MSTSLIDRFSVLSALDIDVKASIGKILVFNYKKCQNAVVITGDDNVFGVGSNKDGCLGTGEDGECKKARKITALCKKEILNISVGYGYFSEWSMHLLALSADGSVYSWGSNDFGQLGNGTTNTGQSPAPVTNIQHKKIVQVACGAGHSLALSDDGEIYAWGYNGYGQIGSVTWRNQLVPLKVTSQIGTRRAISIACGVDHSVALLDNGEVYTWGHNGEGQLGLGNNDHQSIPCKVEALSGEVITQIVCGYNYTMVLTQKGSIYSWGGNDHGQLGTGDETNYNHPKQILINERFLQIVADQYDESLCISAGLTDTGRVYMWGGNKHTSPYLTEYTIIDEVFANIPDEPFTWRLCFVEGGALKPKHMHTVSSCETQTDINSISCKECEKLRVQLDEIEKERDISLKERENLKKDNDTWSRKHETLFNENQDLLQQNKALCKQIELIRTDQAQLSEGDALKSNRMRTVSSCETQTDIDRISVKEFEKLRVKLDEIEKEKDISMKEMENLRKENETLSRKHEILFNENKDLHQELSGYIHQKALKKCWYQLVNDIGDPADICDVLISKDIFSHDKVEEILAEKTNQFKCRHLLNVVRVGGESAFDAFLTALRICHRTHLADLLDHAVSEASGGNR